MIERVRRRREVNELLMTLTDESGQLPYSSHEVSQLVQMTDEELLEVVKEYAASVLRTFHAHGRGESGYQEGLTLYSKAGNAAHWLRLNVDHEGRVG